MSHFKRFTGLEVESGRIDEKSPQNCSFTVKLAKNRRL